MECNKEEAIRAKDIAEKKMLSEDFVTARKIIVKAQQLFPGLENVSQMLTVCDVHCSAAAKVNGEMDWYGILQVGQTADESIIKKQFRKLALLLHPDKNKFGGAEAAFKLVGEAHRTLMDKPKRIQHDMRRGASFRTIPVKQPAQQQNRNSVPKKQPGVSSNFSNGTSAKFNRVNKQQQPPFSGTQTFWTICPSCGIRYQYYLSILTKAIRCQSCKKPFVAHEYNASAAPWNRAGFPNQEKQIPAADSDAQKSNLGTGSSEGSASEPHSGLGSNVESLKEDVKVDKNGRKADDIKFEKVKLQEASKKEQETKSSAGNRGQKRGRKAIVESSDSESSDSDVIVQDGYSCRPNNGSYPRRSTRQKQNISYNEDKIDDDHEVFVGSESKKTKPERTSPNAEENGVKFQGEASGVKLPNGLHEREQNKQKRDTNASVNFISDDSPESDAFSYPDPEFGDFEKEREESKFAPDQIWAIYDNSDAMPRYYALIRQVYRPKFQLRFNWLEFDPTCETETLLFEGGLPIGCGNFKLGKSEYTQERLMFSHLMSWRKGTKRSSYDIVPRKGEVWAVFKNWAAEWGFCIENGRQFEYEVVEVLSDFTEGDVINSIRLVKVQGFVSLFVQEPDPTSGLVKTEMKDILQFSHKIPSYKITGNEREGVPKGCLELDCASLPTNFGEIFPSVSLEKIKARVEELDSSNDLQSKSAGHNDNELEKKGSFVETQSNGDVSLHKNVGSCKKEPSNSATNEQAAVNTKNHVESETETSKQQEDWYSYPDAEFHNFEEDRSIEKFEQGQIWALYSDINKFPNYYGRISKIELDSSSTKLTVTWLEGFTEGEEEEPWFAKNLPVGCGTFRLVRDYFESDSTDPFSHMVHTTPAGRKNHFVMHPRVGEIWALYKNWKIEWSLSDLENCGFDVVEIVAVASSAFEVSVLSKVNGYRAVFRHEVNGITTIPVDKRLLFSHQIPAFRLTEERGGKLRGYWELDPASVPDVLLFTDI